MDLEKNATIYQLIGYFKTKQKKNDDGKMKSEEPKGDEYIVSPCLRQKV